MRKGIQLIKKIKRMTLRKRLLTGALICCAFSSTLQAQYSHKLSIMPFPGDAIPDVRHHIASNTESMVVIPKEGSLQTFTTSNVREFNGRYQDILYTGYDSDGKVMYSYAYGQNDFMELSNAITSSHNGEHVLIVGSRQDMGGGVDPGSLNGYIMRLRKSDGNIVWTRAYGAELANEEWTGIMQSQVDEEYIVFGRSDNDLMAARIRVDGSLVWMHRYNFGIELDFINPYDIMMNNDNNFVITGDFRQEGQIQQMFALEIDGDGEVATNFTAIYLTGTANTRTQFVHVPTGGYIGATTISNNLPSIPFDRLVGVCHLSEDLSTMLWSNQYAVAGINRNQSVDLEEFGGTIQVQLQMDWKMGFVQLDMTGNPSNYKLYNTTDLVQAGRTMFQFAGRHHMYGFLQSGDATFDRSILIKTGTTGNEGMFCYEEGDMGVQAIPDKINVFPTFWTEMMLTDEVNVQQRLKPIRVHDCTEEWVMDFPSLTPITMGGAESIAFSSFEQNEILYVEFESPIATEANIQILNSAGQIVYQTKETINQAFNSLRVPTNTLNAGLYFVQINANDMVVFSRKLVK